MATSDTERMAELVADAARALADALPEVDQVAGFGVPVSLRASSPASSPASARRISVSRRSSLISSASGIGV